MRWRWVALGALGILGSAFLMLRLMQALQIWGSWVPVAASAVGGFCAAGSMARHAEVDAKREPLLAVAVATVVALFAFKLMPFSERDFVIEVPWVIACASAAGVGAFGAAFWVRRWEVAPPTAVSSLVLNAQLQGGVLVLVLALVVITASNGKLPIALFIAGTCVAGFVTQAVLPVRRIWACSAGSVVIVLIVLSGDVGNKAQLLLGFGGLWLVGALGAWIGWAVARRRLPATVDVPTARVQ